MKFVMSCKDKMRKSILEIPLKNHKFYSNELLLEKQTFKEKISNKIEDIKTYHLNILNLLNIMVNVNNSDLEKGGAKLSMQIFKN